MQNDLFKISGHSSGGIDSLVVTGDEHELNWLEGEKTYGTPYGQFAVLGVDTDKENEVKVLYGYRDLQLSVTRKLTDSGLAERYVFKNVTDEDKTFEIGDLGIMTCFNDNYDIAKVALNKKCHMHVWTGDNTTHIRGIRMNGEFNDNVALVVDKGAIAKYAVNREWNSNDRGDISLLLPAMTIKAGEKYELGFTIFKYGSPSDFLVETAAFDNYMNVKCNKYTVKVGETFNIVLRGELTPTVSYNGETIAVENVDKYTNIAKYSFGDTGAKRIDVYYGDDRHTFVELNVVSSVKELIDKRIEFIIDKQQCRKNGIFNGAIFLYDNEEERTFVENRPINDRNIARERVGMLCAMLERYLRGDMNEDFEKKLRSAIDLGMDFVDKNIVNYRGSVFEAPIYRKMLFVDRLYNYSMYMTAYILMYKVTKNKKYLDKAYLIAKRYYKKGGIRFYAINIPMNTMYREAKNNGYHSMAKELKEMFLSHGDRILEIGIEYPAHEVKYEQSIVAPSVDTLLECYLISEDRKYLDEAEKQLKLLEAFNGHQPSFHMNEVSIRHWDGFWFGKRKMYGDTFPHYWSCITAAVFAKYAYITGNETYSNRAEICLTNNLCLFTEEGRGSCAYVYPYLINGKRGEFYDPWANDQDWAIYFNLRYGKTFSKWHKEKFVPSEKAEEVIG